MRSGMIHPSSPEVMQAWPPPQRLVMTGVPVDLRADRADRPVATATGCACVIDRFHGGDAHDRLHSAKRRAGDIEVLVWLRSPAEFGLMVRDQRRAVGSSQQQLADRVGVSRRWVVQMEQGKPGAELGLVLKTLSALTLQVQVDLPAASRTKPARVAPFSLVDLNELVAPTKKSRA